jgi:hypothetical protein
LRLKVPGALQGGPYVGGGAVGVDKGPVRQQNAGQSQAAGWVLVHVVAPVRGRKKARSAAGWWEEKAGALRRAEGSG